MSLSHFLLNPSNAERLQDKLHFDWTPLVDLCLIGFFWAIASSQWMVPLGVGIDLPRTLEPTYANLNTAAVLTLKSNNLIFFENEKLSMEELPERLAKKLGQSPQENNILLVKADRGIPAEDLLRLCDLATQAGFASIQIAAERAP